MNVICRDTLIASSDTLVLQRENTMTGQTFNDKICTIAEVCKKSISKLIYTGEKCPKYGLNSRYEEFRCKSL